MYGIQNAWALGWNSIFFSCKKDTIMLKSSRTANRVIFREDFPHRVGTHRHNFAMVNTKHMYWIFIIPGSNPFVARQATSCESQ